MIESFRKGLQQWYEFNKRSLPWRQTKNPYLIWLSEIILQQTRVEQGLPYFEAFSKAYPTVFDLASAKEEEVLKLWQGLGYYSRARNLHQTAKYIVEELKGEFPRSYDGLIQLKGVGPYTAAAIASFCFDEPRAVVDGNVYRVLARTYGIKTPINSSLGVKEFQQLANELLDSEKPAAHNQAIMEFGSQQCKPKAALCEKCFFNEKCYAFQKQVVADFPVKEKKIKIKKRTLHYYIVLDPQKRTLLHKRVHKDIWQNLYDFPLIEQPLKPSFQEIVKLLAKKGVYGLRQHWLWSEDPLVHKLSHQELSVSFTVLEVTDNLEEHKEAVHWSKLQFYAVPVLIQNFINRFKF
ncbi:MAG: A/G-specific adenine glycosylase [Flavobacteriaceae bacterium]|nr:A/G-specific adenine glycosylase [Flavobacteriaceae bacterium]